MRSCGGNRRTPRACSKAADLLLRGARGYYPQHLHDRSRPACGIVRCADASRAATPTIRSRQEGALSWAKGNQPPHTNCKWQPLLHVAGNNIATSAHVTPEARRSNLRRHYNP